MITGSNREEVTVTPSNGVNTMRSGLTESGFAGFCELAGKVAAPALDEGAATFPARRAQRKRRRRRLLLTTKTEEKAMAAPAIMGLSRPRAASGRAATL